MRSRYSAYALGLTSYVQTTTHPGGPNFEADTALWTAGIEAFSRGTRFQTLTISEHTEQGEQAWVTFDAGLTQGDQDASFSERSYFERIDGCWLYKNGVRNR
jgi:SEC-C motif-containing protein